MVDPKPYSSPFPVIRNALVGAQPEAARGEWVAGGNGRVSFGRRVSCPRAGLGRRQLANVLTAVAAAMFSVKTQVAEQHYRRRA